jgi:4-amino-4-deoxy-L-arabinose transferase-like glycosyltransferase
MSAGPSRPARVPAWALLVIVIAGSAALFGFDLGRRVLATNDEARFPVMARDILANGHWLLPETSGGPMLNKPPLHAWLIALAAWPSGGVSQRAAVVPSFLGALAVVMLTYWIARRLFEPGTALAAGVTVATTAGMYAMARSPVPDMTLACCIVAAMVAFVAAELEGKRGAWLGFYLLVGLACWVKGPAGLLPLVVALAYEVTTFGWRGVARMRVGVGAAILVILIAPWWALAANAGREQFVHDVVRADMMQGYNPLRALSWHRIVEPLSAAATILFPWSVLLPLAAWWTARRWKTEAAAGERLALVWALAVFAVVAASSRQRWRYYLPLCVPGALLLAPWLAARLAWRRTAATLAAGAVAAAILVVGGSYIAARDNRGTQLSTIARAIEGAPAPVFALDAPELVFSFYLERPIRAISAPAELRGLDPPLYVIARSAPADSFDPSAEGRVNGRSFVLWVRRSIRAVSPGPRAVAVPGRGR